MLLLWGVTVVADSAQFSRAVSELAPSGHVGTALTLQTSLGFLLEAGLRADDLWVLAPGETRRV